MMEIPFLWLALSLMAGTLLQGFYVREILWPLLLILIPVLYFLRGRKTFWIFLCSGFVLLGMIYSHLDRQPAKTSLEAVMEKIPADKSFSVIGTIKNEPETKIQGRKQTVSFVFESSRITRWDEKRHPVSYSAKGNVQVFLNQPEQKVQIGDKLRLWGKVEALPPRLNPGGFDYKSYLEAKDIHFILNVYGSRSIRVLKAGTLKDPARVLAKIRQKIREQAGRLFNSQEALLVDALILGDRKNLKGKLLDDFLKTGTSHLLAISGLNISMVAGSFYFILIVLRMGQKRAALLALLIAMFQVAIAGFGIPVQRAGIMACLGFLALILERERVGLNIFSLAFLVLLLADTRSLQNISFQLSFLSLFCLILFSQRWNRKWSWAEAWAGSAAVLAGTFPVVVYHFSTFSPIGILTNILGIPLFHFILLTAFFALGFGSIPLIGTGMISICRGFIKAGLGWIHFCAGADWGYFFLPRPSWPQMILYYLMLAGFVICLNFKNRKRWFWGLPFFAGWLFIASGFFVRKPVSHFEMTFFAAGSNEIAHIQFGDDNQWLINSGRTFPGDQAQWILAPYLRSKGVKKLKGVLFMDFRKRHTAGFETLQRDFRFQYQVYPFPGAKGGIQTQKPWILMHSGDKIHMPEEGKVEILGHDRGQLTFRIKSSGHCFLFLPELSFKVFQQLLGTKDHQADVLILPSRVSDSAIFKSILTITKASAVISPRLPEDFEKILEERKLRGFDLASEGAVQVRLEEKGQKMIMESFLEKNNAAVESPFLSFLAGFSLNQHWKVRGLMKSSSFLHAFGRNPKDSNYG